MSGRSHSWFLAFLLLVCAPVGAQAEPSASEQVKALFPASEVVLDESRGGSVGTRVSPVKRDEVWGFATGAKHIRFKDSWLLFFEMRLGAKDAAGAKDMLEGRGPKMFQQLVQVVLLDDDGTFVGKPEGYPLVGEFNSECLGDLCIGQGVHISKVGGLTDGHSIAWMTFVQEGSNKLVAFHATGGALKISRTIHLDGVDDLSGCELDTEFQGLVWKDGGLTATLVDHCEPDNCPEECASRGIKAGSTSAKRDVNLAFR